MKIHLACGKHVLSGWFNCDMVKHPKAVRPPELLGVDVGKIPLADGCASEVMGIHILEHFYEWEVQDILSEWYRLLEEGGKLTLEMPDIYKSAKNLVTEIEQGKTPSNKWSMHPLYGDNTLADPLMCHRWGWTYKTLLQPLQKAGFRRIVEKPTEWHGKKQNRDFRVEAIK